MALVSLAALASCGGSAEECPDLPPGSKQSNVACFPVPVQAVEASGAEPKEWEETQTFSLPKGWTVGRTLSWYDRKIGLRKDWNGWKADAPLGLPGIGGGPGGFLLSYQKPQTNPAKLTLIVGVSLDPLSNRTQVDIILSDKEEKSEVKQREG